MESLWPAGLTKQKYTALLVTVKVFSTTVLNEDTETSKEGGCSRKFKKAYKPALNFLPLPSEIGVKKF